MNTQEYRKHKAVNFSSLKHILRSPAHYRAAIEGPIEQSHAMLLGTLTHAVALEGKDLLEMVAIKPPGMNLTTKEGKAWKAENEGRQIIDWDDVSDIQGMANSVRNHPYASHILKQCQHRETPILASLKGVECKALLDAHGTDGKEWVVVDLKTTDDASPDAFARKVANLHYDFQASFYSSLLAQAEQIEERPFWFWIAVEKTAPYTCAVYTSEEWLDSGDEKMMRALDLYKQCSASGDWHGPEWAKETYKLPKPKWA